MSGNNNQVKPPKTFDNSYGSWEPRTRSSASYESMKGIAKARVGSTWTVTDYPFKFLTSSKITSDTPHGALWRSIERWGHPPNSVADAGSSFYSRTLTKRAAYWNGFTSTPVNGSLYNEYSGPLFDEAPDTARFVDLKPIDDFTLHAYGNKARSLVNPANPATSVGQGIGELRSREGFPSGIPGLDNMRERAHFYNTLGDKYLNLQFGWLSFLRDLRSAAQATKDQSLLLSQYERNRGAIVRRRFSFPDLYSWDESVKGTQFVYPFPSTRLFLSGGYSAPVTESVEISQRTWFSGAFTYYVSPGMTPERNARYISEANKLLGTRITPSLLWELAPWTWLTDYFVDLGSVLQNLEAQVLDGSVMWYGYVMCEQNARLIRTLPNIRLVDHPAITLYSEYETNIKQRVRATPFGFGLSPNSLSMKQWSILAALGISRV